MQARRLEIQQIWSGLKPATFAYEQSKSRIWPIQFWVFVFLTLALFFVPLSSSLKSVTVVISLCCISFAPVYRQALIKTLNQNWCQAILCLMLLALIGCLWSPASYAEKALILEKYSKLLYLPIFTVGFADERTRRVALNAFLLAMLITCVISIAKYFNWTQYGHGVAAADPGTVFRNHIMTSYMMVFAVYLCGVILLQHTGVVRLMYGLLALLLSYQILFINTSRTGYVMYGLLMLLFIIQELSWRKALVGTLIGSCVLIGSVQLSPVMHQKINEALTDWQRYQHHDLDTPVGFRLQFHRYAADLYHRHPWYGNGTASFTYYYGIEKPVAVWTRRLLEPHSQYWLVIAEWGRVGIIALLFFFGSLFT